MSKLKLFLFTFWYGDWNNGLYFKLNVPDWVYQTILYYPACALLSKGQIIKVYLLFQLFSYELCYLTWRRDRTIKNICRIWGGLLWMVFKVKKCLKFRGPWEAGSSMVKNLADNFQSGRDSGFFFSFHQVFTGITIRSEMRKSYIFIAIIAFSAFVIWGLLQHIPEMKEMNQKKEQQILAVN